MISLPGAWARGAGRRESGRSSSSRAPAPSLPNWRLALDVAGVLLGSTALVLLLVVMEPIR